MGGWAVRRAARRTTEPANAGAARCRRKFLTQFPKGFRDATYLDWERDYKWETHQRWEQVLSAKVDLNDLKPRDMIDIQSFLWVQGSEEY